MKPLGEMITDRDEQIKALESALADERTAKTALEEKLRVATEALEWIEKHSYITNDQWDDVPTMAARKAKEALAKIKAPQETYEAVLLYKKS